MTKKITCMVVDDDDVDRFTLLHFWKTTGLWK